MTQMRLPVDYKKEVHKSVFNLSTVKRTTLLPGMIIPIYSRRCMAGDKFIIDINALLKSVPLSSPLYGTFKLQTTVFFDSDTNYYGYLDNNSKLSTQDLLSKKCHRFNFGDLMEHAIDRDFSSDDRAIYFSTLDGAEHLFNGTFNNFRGSVLDYMGMPSGYLGFGADVVDASDSFSQPIDIGFILTYLNIFRNYYANKQSEKFPFIHELVYSYDGSDPSFDDSFARELSSIQILDELFMELRNSKDGIDFNSASFDDVDSETGSVLRPGLQWLKEKYLPSLVNSCGGILFTTYLPDLYRNLLDDTFNTKVSRVSTLGGNFTIDSLRFANKLQRLVDRFDISGGRFSDWLRTVWGVDTRKDMDIPEIIGASQSLIDPSQVTAMAQTGDPGSDGSTDLGQFGGNFDNFSKQRKHSFVASTPGRVMVCVTLVPMVDYSQGIEPELLEVNMADRYFPEFENLGYQKVPGSWYNPCYSYSVHKDTLLEASSTSYTVGSVEYGASASASGSITHFTPNSVVGKQVAWLPLMTDVNRCHGEFGNHGYYENWVLKRRYTYSTQSSFEYDDEDRTGVKLKYKRETISVYNTLNQYVNPLDFQYPFLLRSVTDPNWFLQMAFDIKAIRPKGKRIMPNLE